MTDQVNEAVACVERKIRWRQQEIARLRGEAIQVSETVNLVRQHETALADLHDVRAALQAAALPAVPEVDAMVNRFLAWPLPSDFGPDAGISFTPCPHPNGWPVGTNLLTAVQAKAMFLHCIAAPSASPAVPDGWVYGWLIENGRSPPDLRYRAFDSVGMPYWTDDNAKAIRLCRREDAEQLAAGDEDAWRIVEHRWLAATPAHDQPEGGAS